MKMITEREFGELVDTILRKSQKQAEKNSTQFMGINSDELHREIAKALGDDWRITNEQPVKFSRADINAVAGARYFRKTGITLLMAMAIVVLGLSTGMRYAGIALTTMNLTIYYSILGVAFVIFMGIYTRGQSKIRKALWRQLGREEAIEK